jgi:hypothetical protein
MDSYSILLVNERIEQLRREAAERREFAGGPTLARRIGAALGAIAAAITAPASTDDVSPAPTLDAYPYRG